MVIFGGFIFSCISNCAPQEPLRHDFLNQHEISFPKRCVLTRSPFFSTLKIDHFHSCSGCGTEVNASASCNFFLLALPRKGCTRTSHCTNRAGHCDFRKRFIVSKKPYGQTSERFHYWSCKDNPNEILCRYILIAVDL